MSNKYLPGQRLDTAADLIDALRDGQKICGLMWDPGNFIHLVDGQLVNSNGVEWQNLYTVGGKWTIYTPPKRKIVSTRWFAVVRNEAIGDGVAWYVCADEIQAKNTHPNALAYVKAEVEVEVDDDGAGGGGG